MFGKEMIGMFIVGLFGSIVGIFGMFHVLKTGKFYIWGSPIYRKNNYGQFWFLFFNIVFLTCVSLIFLGIPLVSWLLYLFV